MVIDRGLHEVSDADIPEILAEAAGQDLPVFMLSTAGRTDKEAFFEAVRETLPLDPPLGTSRTVWDALSDSVWGGLHALKRPRVVIVWPGVRPTSDTEDDFQTALSILRDVVATLTEARYTGGRPTWLSVYVARASGRGGEAPAKG
ncbi:barstar family protein [Streptomyces sp. NPDC060235]|uniref:barstar family protein n=1 Tax=Streptomyces sp. NPDC060235 TaxID=3347080 RepID=UPI00366906B1